MKRHLLAVFAGVMIEIAFASSGAFAQQATPGVSAYLVSMELTGDGVKVLQKENVTPTAISTSVAKFSESIGGKLESWYFNQLGTTSYGIFTYQGKMTSDSLTLDITVKANNTEIAHVTMRPLITAPDADDAFAVLSQALKKQ